jgi:hypothetical protein
MYLVRPLRRSGLLLPLTVGVLLTVCTVAPADAQVQSSQQPSGGLLDNAEQRPGQTPPRFQRNRKPGEKPPRPQYGSPPGYGASTTGYISTNVPRPKAKKPELARAQTQTVDPAALLRNALLALRRRGPSLDPPLTVATPLIRRGRALESDPFDPTGIHVGSFLVRPAVELYAAHDSNAERTQGGRSSWYTTVAPELLVRSDWNRHAFTADIRGSYTEYQQTPALTRPFFDARFNGRIDIYEQTRADLEAHEYVTTTYPGSPDLPAGVARLPLYMTTGASGALVHRINRLEFTAKAGYDRVIYQDAQLTDGSTVSNRDRNYDQYSALLRAAYELTPGFKPFVELQADTRHRDLPLDAYGLERSSAGAQFKIGTSFELSRTITGEMSVGYLSRRYKDPTLPELQGYLIDGALIWVATGLTTAKLTARTSGDETTLPGVAGVLRRDIGVQVDHAFRRWLIGTARVGYGFDDYQGSDRHDIRSVYALGLNYKLNREWQVRSEVRREALQSTVPGANYTAYVAMLGVRLQR